MHFLGEIPQNYYTFVLFDPPKIGNLNTHPSEKYAQVKLDHFHKFRGKHRKTCFKPPPRSSGEIPPLRKVGAKTAKLTYPSFG